MYDELEAFRFGALGYGSDGRDSYATLNIGVFQVVQRHISEQEDAHLAEAPAVVLNKLAREQNSFTHCQLFGYLKVVLDVCVVLE